MIFKDVYTYNMKGDVTNYFEFFSDVELSKEIQEVVLSSMVITIKHKDFQDKSKVKLTLFVRSSKQVTITFDDNDLGNQANFAFINYEILKNKHNVEQHIIFVEEFVHHFWDCHDEKTTKGIVCDIFKANKNPISYDFENSRYLYGNTPLSVG